jgi:hypothetical protein
MRYKSPSGLQLAFLIWIAFTLGCAGGQRAPSRPQLTAEHRDAINKALKARGYPAPTLTVSDSDYLVATFELQHAPQQSFRAYAEDALLTIRNVMLPFRAFENYRVTLNGPPPGPGLIRRYGNARFVEGGRVTWEPAE